MQSLAADRIPGYLESARDRDVVLYDLCEDARSKRCQFVWVADEKLRSRKKSGRTSSNALSAGSLGSSSNEAVLQTAPPFALARRPARRFGMVDVVQRATRTGAGGWCVPSSMRERRRRGEPRHQRPPGGTRSHPRRCADAWGVGEGMRDGVGVCGVSGQGGRGRRVIVNTCLSDNGRSLCGLVDFQKPEVD